MLRMSCTNWLGSLSIEMRRGEGNWSTRLSNVCQNGLKLVDRSDGADAYQHGEMGARCQLLVRSQTTIRSQGNSWFVG
jgi:hypothetical protein